MLEPYPSGGGAQIFYRFSFLISMLTASPLCLTNPPRQGILLVTPFLLSFRRMLMRPVMAEFVSARLCGCIWAPVTLWPHWSARSNPTHPAHRPGRSARPRDAYRPIFTNTVSCQVAVGVEYIVSRASCRKFDGEEPVDRLSYSSQSTHDTYPTGPGPPTGPIGPRGERFTSSSFVPTSLDRAFTIFCSRFARFISACIERSARALNLSASGSSPGCAYGSALAYV